jgi:hypothetical protein
MVTRPDALEEAGQIEASGRMRNQSTSMVLQALKSKGHDAGFAERGDSRGKA